MIQSLTKGQFRDAFNSVRPENFSYKGLGVLHDYLTELEDDCGMTIELDVIALCCDYSESSIEDVLEDYSLDSIEELENNTTVLKVDNETVIYQAY